jgi:hypothetical protein
MSFREKGFWSPQVNAPIDKAGANSGGSIELENPQQDLFSRIPLLESDQVLPDFLESSASKEGW